MGGDGGEEMEKTILEEKFKKEKKELNKEAVAMSGKQLCLRSN